MSAETISVEFDAKTTDLSAIKKAAYRLSDVVTVDITSSDSTYHCRLIGIADDKEALNNFEHLFRSTVLDEELRQSIGEKTEGLRNAILALAFAPFTKQGKD